MKAIVKENAAYPEQLQSGVRKWLTYIALLATAGTMIGDLIWFLNYLLLGEITVRFFLKSTVVMIVCGGIFMYYLRSLRSREQRLGARDSRVNGIFAISSATAVSGVFIVGLTVAGTPGQIRKQEADTKRVQDVKQLGYAFEVRYGKQRNEGHAASMPATLDQLAGEGISDAATRDPQTHVQYEYRVIGDMRYELCANFSSAPREEEPETKGSIFWRHGGGRTCYALDATGPVPD